MTTGTLKIKTALITGASGGIGKAIALRLAKNGYKLVVHFYQQEHEAKEVIDEVMREGGEAFMIQADLGDYTSTMTLAEQAWEKLGKVDLLVNNAGVSYKKNFLSQTPEDIELLINVNFKGTLFLTQAIADRMVQSGVKGSIYTLTSVNAVRPGPGHSVYGATKGALETLMKGLALEFAPYQIRVNTLVIGAIKTAMNEAVWKDDKGLQALEEYIPLGRIGEADDVARIVAQLVGHDDYMTGSSITIDGGWLIKTGFEATNIYEDGQSK